MIAVEQTRRFKSLIGSKCSKTEEKKNLRHYDTVHWSWVKKSNEKSVVTWKKSDKQRNRRQCWKRQCKDTANNNQN